VGSPAAAFRLQIERKSKAVRLQGRIAGKAALFIAVAWEESTSRQDNKVQPHLCKRAKARVELSLMAAMFAALNDQRLLLMWGRQVLWLEDGPLAHARPTAGLDRHPESQSTRNKHDTVGGLQANKWPGAVAFERKGYLLARLSHPLHCHRSPSQRVSRWQTMP
jgi:hypothetical protein